MFNKENQTIKPFDQKVWLASPTMHGPELKYVKEAYDTNWMSTVGKNINEVEKIAAEKADVKYAVGLSSCTAALHLCAKLAGEKLYGKPEIGHGALEGKKVLCSDMTFDATLNPVVYEGGIPVFIDTDPVTWNMDPKALEKAFEMYPEVKLVVMAHLYGFPGDIQLMDSRLDLLVIILLFLTTEIKSLLALLEDAFSQTVWKMLIKLENGVLKAGKMHPGISMKKLDTTTE